MGLATIVAGSLYAQSPFPSDLERFLWKDLGAWGSLPLDTPLQNNVPGHDFTETGDYDLFSQPIRVSNGDYQTQVANLAIGECTNSQNGDYNAGGPVDRQCRVADDPGAPGVPVMAPPPLGALLDPVALAVDGTRVYVADDFNNRIQVFDFYGEPLQLDNPIGDGMVGTGVRLSEPNGVAVDAAHNVVVADGGNARIAVFNDQGALQFDAPIGDGVSGPTKPTLVAMTPGTTLLPPGSALPTDAHVDDRVVVTDWSHCHVLIYDRRFQLKTSLPLLTPELSDPPRVSSHHDGCLEPDGQTSLPGEFSTVTGVAVDAAGHIFVSDHAQNVVQVFDKEGVFLGWIGRPGIADPPGELSGPVGVMIDHLGRLGVIDAGNARVVFYDVAFTSAPEAVFVFQLDTTVSVDDFPMGLAEQVGDRPALDPKGRLLVTDPLKRRVLRFELPELGIVNASADAGVGTFSVLVPSQKTAPVLGVSVTVSPTQVGVNFTEPTPTGLVDIPQGQYVTYSFDYDSPFSSTTFVITATGDNGNAVADPAIATARQSCAACNADHIVYYDPPPASGAPVLANLVGTPSNGNWYGQEVFVRLIPTGTDPVSHIFWTLGGEAGLSYDTDIHESAVVDGHVDSFGIRVGGKSTLTYWAVTADGAEGPQHNVALWLDLAPPRFTFTSWTPGASLPDPQGVAWYNFAVPQVVGTYTVEDSYASDSGPGGSGTATTSGSVTFTDEGRLQSESLSATDGVGRTETVESGDASNGRFINIDRTPPGLTAPAGIEIGATGQAYGVIPAGSFVATASADPPLADGADGSGFNPATSTLDPGLTHFSIGDTDFEFVARDWAGNANSVIRKVTVNKAPSSVSYNGPATAPVTSPVTLSAVVLPGWAGSDHATGTVTFTVGTFVGTASLVNGVATLTVPADTISAGSGLTVGLSYSGDGALKSSTGSGTITITQRASVTITVDPKTRRYGDSNPPLTATVTGLPVGGTLDYSLSTEAGPLSPVGPYPITVALGSNPLYSVTVVEGTLSVTPRPAQVSPRGIPPNEGLIFRLYGEDPITFTSTDVTITGAVIGGDPINYTLITPATIGLLPGQHAQAGDYDLTADVGPNTNPAACEPGSMNNSLNPNYCVRATVGILRIAKRAATISAAATIGLNDAKIFGQADPAFTATSAGFLPEDGIVVTAARVAGETVGSYAVKPTASGTYVSNYLVTPTDGTFVINKATVSVTARVSPSTMTYGDPAPTIDFVYGPLPDGFTAAQIDTPPACSSVGGFTADPTPHAVNCAGAADHDVDFTYVPASLTVYKKAVILTGMTTSKVYGAADPLPLGATQEGMVPGDVAGITLSSTRVAGEDAGTYATTPHAVGGAIANYEITPVTGLFSITRATPAVSVTGGSFEYSATAHPATCTVNGVNGETLTGTITYAPGPGAPVNAGTYGVSCGFAGNTNYFAAVPGTATITIDPKPITVTADAKTKIIGHVDPALTYMPLTLLGTDAFTGALMRDPGEDLGTYAIRQNTLSAGSNYSLTFVTALLTIVPANFPPVAAPDTATTTSFVPIFVNVLANDTDADHDPISLVSVTQPLVGGTVAIVGTRVFFTPIPGFSGMATFTYTISDGHVTSIGTVTILVSVGSCTTGGFTTYTQGGWGAKPSGKNPAMLLKNKFALVYPGGSVVIGGTKTLTFTSAKAIEAFLPARGTPGKLTASATNPTSSKAGVFAGQVLALQLSVDFSNAGVTKPGLSMLTYNGFTVAQWLALANEVLGGNTTHLAAYGVKSVSALNTIIDNFNNNFDNGTNKGLLSCPPTLF